MKKVNQFSIFHYFTCFKSKEKDFSNNNCIFRCRMPPAKPSGSGVIMKRRSTESFSDESLGFVLGKVIYSGNSPDLLEYILFKTNLYDGKN